MLMKQNVNKTSRKIRQFVRRLDLSEIKYHEILRTPSVIGKTKKNKKTKWTLTRGGSIFSTSNERLAVPNRFYDVPPPPLQVKNVKIVAFRKFFLCGE